MKIIIGLGNPGGKYEKTRHNAGFEAIECLAKKCGTTFQQEKFNAEIAEFSQNGEKVLLMKPLTYMNASGEALIQAMKFYKVEVKDILVMHDDLDLPVGKIRIRYQGSAGGQKGMLSIQQHLHTQEIGRIRIGIDKSPIIPVVDYVLGKVPSEEREQYNEAIEKAAEAALYFLSHSIVDVMNRFNT
ncbi:MAG: aminoacyl-tRNA hydrolase [Anaerorhabdus sp.]